MMRWLIFLACAGLVWAQRSPLENAWDLAAKGQNVQAIRILRELIGKNPQDADARLLLGSLLVEAGNAPEAISQLTKAVQIRPRSAEAQNALGEAYSRFGDEQSARKPYERAVALRPGFGVAQLNLGRVLLSAGELKPAGDHLDRAIELLGHDSDAADAHYLRAKVFTAMDDVQDAAAQLQRAVSLRPDFAEAWSDLGQARTTLQDDTGAVAALKRAVDLAPGDPVAQRRLGSAYLLQNQAHLAVEHLRKAYSLAPGDQSTLNSLQAALRQDGNAQEANRIKKELAELLLKKDQLIQQTVTATQLNNEGAALQKSGDLQGALEKYRQAVSLTPENVPMRVNYSIALLRLGAWTEGLNQLHEALARDPANPKIRAAWNDALAQAPPGAASGWKDQDHERVPR